MAGQDPTPSPDPDQALLLNHGQTLRELAKSKKFGPQIKRMIKEQWPDTPLPEVELEDRFGTLVDERVKGLQDENKTLKTDLEQMKGLINKSMFASEHGLTEDELVEVETFAKENGVTKGDKAVALWRERQQLGVPRTSPQRKIDDEYRGELLKASRRGTNAVRELVTKQADRVLREMRGGRIR